MRNNFRHIQNSTSDENPTNLVENYYNKKTKVGPRLLDFLISKAAPILSYSYPQFLPVRNYSTKTL